MSEFKLQRYALYPYQIVHEPDANGKWVKWEDIEPLLKAYLSVITKFNKIKAIVSEIITVR